jgi:DNA repair exonuclease SbcCD ATPase subunit
MFSAAQAMSEEMAGFEQEENQLRPQMPGVFSVGEFKSDEAAQTLTVECRTYFARMLSTMQKWADKAREEITEHNAKLNVIKQEVLMSVQQQIDQAVGRAT